MTPSKNLPTLFPVFPNKKKRMEAEVKGNLNRFAYRYRLAKSFIGMNAPEVGKTLAGYDALVKLFLAYTAYEEIVGPACALRIPNVKPINQNIRWSSLLAERLRKSAKLVTYLRNYHNGTALATRIEKAFNTAELWNDITCVAYGLRSAFAHGDLTPSAIGGTNKKGRALLTDLANELIDYSDELFTKCMQAV